jgi:hypothetical protein
MDQLKAIGQTLGKEVRKTSAIVATNIIGLTAEVHTSITRLKSESAADVGNSEAISASNISNSTEPILSSEQIGNCKETFDEQETPNVRSRSSSSSSWSDRLSGIIKREWEWVDETHLQGYDEIDNQQVQRNQFSLIPKVDIQCDELGGHISNIVLQQSDVMYSLYEKYSNVTTSFMDSAQLKTASTLSSFYNNCLDLSTTTCGTWSHDSTDQYVHKIPTSFAMSGCGWLIPFHLGVIQAFKNAGYINEKTVFAGTSGGAIGALVGCMDIPTGEALDELIQLSTDENFKTNIDVGLKGVLKRIVKLKTAGSEEKIDDVSGNCSTVDSSKMESNNIRPTETLLQRCNDRLHVTVTKLWPKPTLVPIIVSNFGSEDHLLEVIAASCFIPLYSSPMKMMTNIAKVAAAKVASTTTNIAKAYEHTMQNKAINPSASVDQDSSNSVSIEDNAMVAQVQVESNNEYYIDGGVFAFIPPVGEVKISPFPSKYIRSFVEADITLSPDDFSMRQLLTWVLYPGTEENLRELYVKGHNAACTWIKKHEDHIQR